MTIELVKPVQAPPDPLNGELCHLACCRYKNGRIIAFCGSDVTDERRVDSWPNELTCVMCVEVGKGKDHEHCPMSGDLCPDEWEWA